MVGSSVGMPLRRARSGYRWLVAHVPRFDIPVLDLGSLHTEPYLLVGSSDHEGIETRFGAQIGEVGL